MPVLRRPVETAQFFGNMGRIMQHTGSLRRSLPCSPPIFDPIPYKKADRSPDKKRTECCAHSSLTVRGLPHKRNPDRKQRHKSSDAAAECHGETSYQAWKHVLGHS